jgi:aldose sugar dehydrogenase
VITHGVAYSGLTIGEGITEHPDMQSPLYHWTPSIAPSGMAFYDGGAIEGWQGNLFVGALAGQHLARLELDGEQVVAEERLLDNTIGRIRDVRSGPDGFLYLLTDHGDGGLYRLEPAG